MNLGRGNLLLEQQVVLADGISVSLPSRALLSLVFQAVHQVEWPKRVSNPSVLVPEPVLRSVLTFCYAIGMLGSEEIEAAAVHDDIVHYLCVGSSRVDLQACKLEYSIVSPK